LNDWRFCQETLPQVSRTFGLGIKLLPAELCRPVTIAYLICRIVDTIEDNAAMSVADRVSLLARVKQILIDPKSDVGDLLPAARLGEEITLMGSAHRVFSEFGRLPVADQDVIRRWVLEMIAGMARSLPLNRADLEPMFERMSDLDQYCYFVAGTVGHLLTGLFALHCRGIDATRRDRLEARATSFGLGLQLTNVIRDVADDHREGRNLIPREVWQRTELRPEQFFSAGMEKESWQVMEPLLDSAAAHLQQALQYCTELPRFSIRVRLFCFSSLVFACRTLHLVRRERDRMHGGSRVKMPRREVYLLLALGFLAAPFNWALRLLIWIVSGGAPSVRAAVTS
jgi:farnesyl-diphosphate farnesyltransferase